MEFPLGSWDSSYMEDAGGGPEKTPLQLAVERALADAPKTRDHYDRMIQERTGKKGKVLFDIQRGKSKNPGMATLRHVAAVFDKPVTFFTDLAPAREPDLPPTRSASEGETVEITSLDLSFSMGPGTTIDDYIEETPVQFDLGFLRQITRSAPTRLRLARGIGDSMFPTLLPNDRVMIDTTQRMLNLGDRVYAISLYGAAAIKRLRTLSPTQVEVISDNPNVPNQTVSAEDLIIAGRVIWFGRDL